jgi:hypothetical protein
MSDVDKFNTFNGDTSEDGAANESKLNNNYNIGDYLEDDLFSVNSRVARKKHNKKFALACTSFELGIYAANESQSLFVFTFTSVPGEKNTRQALMRDFRNFRIKMKKEGYIFEDCCCTQKTPESHQYINDKGELVVSVGGLWHLHGVMRFEGHYSGLELHDVISKHWKEIHGAHRVRVEPPWNIKSAVKYDVRDILHDYANENGSRQRLMISKNWIPKGAREFEKKIIKPWAWYHGAGWPVGSDLTDYHLGEYIPYAWHVGHAYLLAFVAGKGIRLEMKHHLIWAQYPEVIVFDEIGHEVYEDWRKIDWNND